MPGLRIQAKDGDPIVVLRDVHEEGHEELILTREPETIRIVPIEHPKQESNRENLRETSTEANLGLGWLREGGHRGFDVRDLVAREPVEAKHFVVDARVELGDAGAKRGRVGLAGRAAEGALGLENARDQSHDAIVLRLFFAYRELEIANRKLAERTELHLRKRALPRLAHTRDVREPEELRVEKAHHVANVPPVVGGVERVERVAEVRRVLTRPDDRVGCCLADQK